MIGNGILLFLIIWPIAGAFICYLIGRKNKSLRCLAADAVTMVEFGLLVFLLIQVSMGKTYHFVWMDFCGLGLTLKLDGFRSLYGLITAWMWMMTTVFSKEYFAHYRNRNRYYLFLLITLGATVGVFLSADLYTTFIFFEIMSFTSYVWIAHDEKEASLRAASTYLSVAVIGGLVMLMGLFLLYDAIGTLNMDQLLLSGREVWTDRSGRIYAAGLLILFGFGAKAGIYPLHIWLPKAHPAAPAPASALLSGILTKVGVFGIAVISCRLFLHDTAWGSLILALGIVTMSGGALLALFSVDLKRTLACSSMSQIGFILVGMGMQGLLREENALAVRGTLLHMVNHSLIKLVLFMAAGVVYQNLHKLDLNEIRGFGRRKPALAVCFLMGALGISGFPLWNGYVSKTLLHESIVEYTHVVAAAGGSAAIFKIIEWTFLISGGITAAYMLKLFIAVFAEKNQDDEVQQKYDSMRRYMNGYSILALAGSAVVLPVMGFLPGTVMNWIADLGQPFFHGMAPAHAVPYFSAVNLAGSAITLLMGLVIYIGVVRNFLMKVPGRNGNMGQQKIYVDRWPEWMDLENLIYRPVLLTILPAVLGFFCRILDRHLLSWSVKIFLAVSSVVCRCMDHMADAVIILARKTTHRQTAAANRHVSGDRTAYVLGLFWDDCVRVFYKTFRRKQPVPESIVPRLMELEEKLVTTNRLIGNSMSFGLMLVCVGLCLTLGYLLFAYADFG